MIILIHPFQFEKLKEEVKKLRDKINVLGIVSLFYVDWIVHTKNFLNPPSQIFHN